MVLSSKKNKEMQAAYEELLAFKQRRENVRIQPYLSRLEKAMQNPDSLELQGIGKELEADSLQILNADGGQELYSIAGSIGAVGRLMVDKTWPLTPEEARNDLTEDYKKLTETVKKYNLK